MNCSSVAHALREDSILLRDGFLEHDVSPLGWAVARTLQVNYLQRVCRESGTCCSTSFQGLAPICYSPGDLPTLSFRQDDSLTLGDTGNTQQLQTGKNPA